MAFKGEISAAILAGKKTGFATGDIYRIISEGKLGDLDVQYGTFVEWKGTTWEVKKDMQYATSKTGESLDQAIADVLDDRDTASAEEELTMPAAEAANYTVGNYFEQDGEIWKCTGKTNNGDGTWTVEADKVNGVVPVLNDLVSAANKQWTRRTALLPIAPAQRIQFDVQDHEFVDLTIQRSGAGTATSYVELHLYGDCYLRLDKNTRVSVSAYVGDSTTEAININTGLPHFIPDISYAMKQVGSDIPNEYDPDEFMTVALLGEDSEFTMVAVAPADITASTLLLHFVGGVLIVTPIP